ncbi:MAG TPA: SGNH/GDSL hydrolase family protein [Candidatus Elarobacter sp.]|nr:SGNH/GDSL hydrolase family protein [Candidatus Elarobacter sp.]
MRRSAALAAMAALAACARRRPEGRRSPASRGAPVHIVALGDSLALGTGASAPRNGFIFRAYLDVLAKHPGSRIDSYAIGGSTAADVLRLQVPRLAHVRADIVVVCVGGNDVVRHVDATRFAATYARLVARVRVLQPHAAIVCCGVPDVGMSPLFTGFEAMAVAGLARSDDAAVRAAARRSGALFVDLFAATAHARGNVNRFLSEDRFHPSDAGYRTLEAVLAPVLLRAAARAT